MVCFLHGVVHSCCSSCQSWLNLRLYFFFCGRISLTNVEVTARTIQNPAYKTACFCTKGCLQWLLCWHQVDFLIKPWIDERTLLTKAATRLFHVQSRCNSRRRGRHRECRFDEPLNDITLNIVRLVVKGWAYTHTFGSCSEAACVLVSMFRSVKMWFWNDFTHQTRTMNLFIIFVLPVCHCGAKDTDLSVWMLAD